MEEVKERLIDIATKNADKLFPKIKKVENIYSPQDISIYVNSVCALDVSAFQIDNNLLQLNNYSHGLLVINSVRKLPGLFRLEFVYGKDTDNEYHMQISHCETESYIHSANINEISVLTEWKFRYKSSCVSTWGKESCEKY